MKFNSNVLALSVVSSLSLFSYAETLPNAGSISRDVEQQQSDLAAQQRVNFEQDIAKKSEVSESDSIEIEVKKIRLVGIEAVGENELATLLMGSEGKTVTIGHLRALTDKITDYYNQKGYHLARAILPPQRIENGEVVIQVFEGKIAGLQVANQSRVADSVVKRYLENGIAVGKALNRTDSERALLLLRDLAGVGEVNYSLAEGKQAGETELVTHFYPAATVRGNIQLDNQGSESTGEHRTRLNVYLNSLFGHGEQISLQGMSSMKGLDYGRVGLVLPLGYNGLRFNTSLARTRYELGGAFENLKADGSSDVIDFSFRYPLLRTNQHNLWLSSGGEFRRLKDNMRATHTFTEKTVHSGHITLNGSFQDRVLAGGLTSFNLQNTVGKLNIRSVEARAIDTVSANTQGSYYKLNLNLNRTQYLNEKWSMVANLSVQWANKNLDSGEQLSLGGFDGVSAYTSNAVSGDKGVVANVQLRYAVNSYIILSSFYDIGRVKLRNKPYTTEKNHRSLQGAGVGLNVNVKDISLEAKAAWKLRKTGLENSRNPSVWLKAAYYF